MSIPLNFQWIGSFLFLGAILHTFAANSIRRLGDKYREGSVAENIFHFLGEVEVVFGIWAALFVSYLMFSFGRTNTIQFLEARSFAEPIFVFIIMSVCSSSPIVSFSGTCLFKIADYFPGLSKAKARYAATLFIGPLLGSFITEPAAMTVVALIMRDSFFSKDVSLKFKYLSLAVLFVNISIGGVLTPYAAPPVLMVSAKWGWDLAFMLGSFGWKAALIVGINVLLALLILGKEFKKISIQNEKSKRIPFWVVAVHLVFLVLLVSFHQTPVVIGGLFLFFLGFVNISSEFQEEIKLKEALLVSFFLGGLVVLGSVQAWWLQPLISRLDSLQIFLGATFLTAFTDNAALTYLGAQVEGLSDAFKYSLVAGAVAGGGLTVIANAPNPAGYSLLHSTFGPRGINALTLALYALIPTSVAVMIFWFA